MSLDDIIRRREIKEILHEYMATLFGAPGVWAQIANIIEDDVCVALVHKDGVSDNLIDMLYEIKHAIPEVILKRLRDAADAEKTRYEKQRVDTTVGECARCAKREKSKCLHPRDGFCAGFEPISEENDVKAAYEKVLQEETDNVSRQH